MPIDVEPNLQVDHNENDEPILVDTSGGTTTTIIVNEIGSGGGGGSSAETVAATGHIYLSSNTTNSEIDRFEIPSGSTLSLDDLQFQQKGGGSEDTSISVDVVDVSAGTTLASTNLNTFSEPTAESGDGAEIVVQWTNDTASQVEASIHVRGTIN